MRRRWLTSLVFLGMVPLWACLGGVDVVRSYFALHGEPVQKAAKGFQGLLRVRTLDADSVYEKFQLVVRKSPYELRYSDLHVWAVKPNQMVSDIIARTLEESGAFAGVITQLGDARPSYTLGGELHAIEIYDSDDLWFAHLAMSLQLTAFSTGERLWTFSYDQRKEVKSGNYSHAVRALSELLAQALDTAIQELGLLADGAAAPVPATGGEVAPLPRIEDNPPPADPHAPIFVPEAPPEEGPK